MEKKKRDIPSSNYKSAEKFGNRIEEIGKDYQAFGIAFRALNLVLVGISRMNPRQDRQYINQAVREARRFYQGLESLAKSESGNEMHNALNAIDSTYDRIITKYKIR